MLSVAEIAESTTRNSRIAAGHSGRGTQATRASSNTNRSEGATPGAPPTIEPLPRFATPDAVPLAPYEPTAEITQTTDQIIEIWRLRQDMVSAQTKLTLQALALLRRAVGGDKKEAAAIFAAVKNGEPHRLAAHVLPHLAALEPIERQRAAYEKSLVKLVRTLPIHAWAKSVKGLGDLSLAGIVGECGDVGTYKSVSAVWKRMGLAVIDGKAQGRPGQGATPDDWVTHGYNKRRRSVSRVGLQYVIGSMGLYRAPFGADDPGATEYQKVFTDRARYEAQALGLPVKESKTGKDSYDAHVANRALRYVEKRVLKHLYLEWRRS
ncbi:MULTISPECIES: hypothetical protein [unclassified Chelatococcus]|uniref:hypothetical protein n=1 Tax=unclassified Chelatococcus TaxID=2638111 RepID=UPI001BCF4AF0|nr:MULTISPECIES: hypothetical protein [unclassified Chelatococcus]MBS7737922.1 hypothetical protein [Chelatococcus sp. HY11]MCO5079376.1 hypothetical protein [Chelatococcus sp.]